MHTPDELAERFRAAGLRVTPQRQAVFRALHGNDRHPTVEALHDAVRLDLPAISLRTVYQTVHDLEGLGEVEVLDLGTGSVRVDPNVDASHQHLVCTSCGAVRDLPVAFDGLTVPHDLRDGFTVAGVEVVFRGVCAPCSTPTIDDHR